MFQLEDAEYSTAAATKARRGVELEVQALQTQLDALQKSKNEADSKITDLTRERNEAVSRAEDADEDYAELMKKYQVTDCSICWKIINSYSASRDNGCTVGGDGGCRGGEVRAGTTSPCPTIRVLSYSS